MGREQSGEILRRLDLNLLVMFEALRTTGSVTRAAEQLDITQSAVSRGLGKLRTFFGDPLFVRGGSRMVPTSKAEQLGETVAGVIAMLRASVLTEAAFDPTLSERTITLSMSDTAEFVTFPAFAARVRGLARRCRLRIVHFQGESLEEALNCGSVDLAVSGPAPLSGDVLQQRLYTSTLAIIASSDQAEREPLSLDEYAQHAQVVVRPARLEQLPMDKMLADAGVARTATIVTPHAMAVPSILVANPDLIATVPAHVGRRFCGSLAIRVVPVSFALPEFPVLQFWHRRNQHDHFSIWLRQQMRIATASCADRPEELSADFL